MGGSGDASAQTEAVFRPPVWPVRPSEMPAAFCFHDLPGRLEIGPVTVETMEGDHPGGVSVLRLTGGGRSVAVLTDCKVTGEKREALAAFASGADLLLIDGQYTPEEWTDRAGFGHNTFMDAAAFGRETGAGRTLIVHHACDRTDAELDAMESGMSRSYPEASFAREGQTVDLDAAPACREEETQSRRERYLTSDRMQRFLGLCLELTSERDRERLLTRILDTAMDLTNCDAGTLYLLQKDGLAFCRMVTRSMGVRQGGHDAPITLPPVPLEPSYVCSWSVLNRCTINVSDVAADTRFDFSGAKRYDAMTGYSTRTMLVVPMANDRAELIGVCQLINAKDADGQVVPFTEDLELLTEAMASQAAITLTNMQYAEQIGQLLDSLVGALSTAIDERTPYNANHTRNMVQYAERFLDWLEETGNVWRFSGDRRRTFLLAVWLHDVGKLTTPLEVMNKPGRLDPEERAVMENHVVVTKRILDRVTFPKPYAEVPQWASLHHELLNGRGYPDHLKAEQIPREVRLLTILDIFEALTARDRPYKPGMPVDKALSILREMSEEGSVDGEILHLFEQSRAWEV